MWGGGTRARSEAGREQPPPTRRVPSGAGLAGRGRAARQAGRSRGVCYRPAWAAAEKLSDPPARPSAGQRSGYPLPAMGRPRDCLSAPYPSPQQGPWPLTWNRVQCQESQILHPQRGAALGPTPPERGAGQPEAPDISHPSCPHPQLLSFWFLSPGRPPCSRITRVPSFVCTFSAPSSLRCIKGLLCQHLLPFDGCRVFQAASDLDLFIPAPGGRHLGCFQGFGDNTKRRDEHFPKELYANMFSFLLGKIPTNGMAGLYDKRISVQNKQTNKQPWQTL